MSIPQDHVFESALALPQAERAQLALQLLESLDPPGEETSAEQFGAELRERVEAYRRGEIESLSVDETRSMVNQQLGLRCPSDSP